MSGAPGTLLAVGLGYCARALVPLLPGWEIIGTSRATFDGTAPTLGPEIARATHLLISAAPAGMGDPLLAQHAGDIAAAPRLEWAGYLSTIGVYGDHGGAWVTEDTPPKPGQPRSIARLAAEADWRALAAGRGLALDIFRIAGIYGPGRNPLERLRAGREVSVVKPGQVFNRIHVDDIAAALHSALSHPHGTRVFNLSDDEPAAPQDVNAYAAALLGVQPPREVPLAEAELSEMAASFYAENKRASNARLRAQLLPTLRYSTFREGLSALAQRG